MSNESSDTCGDQLQEQSSRPPGAYQDEAPQTTTTSSTSNAEICPATEPPQDESTEGKSTSTAEVLVLESDKIQLDVLQAVMKAMALSKKIKCDPLSENRPSWVNYNCSVRHK